MGEKKKKRQNGLYEKEEAIYSPSWWKPLRSHVRRVGGRSLVLGGERWT